MKGYVCMVFIFLNLFIVSFYSVAQTYYWVSFTDKNGSIYSIDKPEEFLSDRAIQRRVKYNIAIDEKDLPVNQEYISHVLELGAEYVHASKWLNGITVKTDSVDFAERVLALDFVREVEATKTNTGNKSASYGKFGRTDDKPVIDSSYYGKSVSQVSQINGQYLHDKGFRGKGIQIAVLDAGFYNVDKLPSFDSLWQDNRILGAVDFVDRDSNVFTQHSHGMMVLSIMGGNLPGLLIGTAPEASYWLLRTEDASVEFKNEEDNWVVGAEFADSVGADIINSSLGYFLFDDPAMDHSYSEMDGNTTRVTRAANIAASRGILVFCSAGNEGDSPWHYIIAPSDGDSVVSVGAVDANGVKAAFSSFGPAFGGAVKPNVSAMGQNTALQNTNGLITTGSGTSFSSPVLAGMAACLWQAYPEFPAMEIKQIIEESASQYDNPDSLLGYGIPDFNIAAQISGSREIFIHLPDEKWAYYPNPFKDHLVLKDLENTFNDEVQIELFGVNGIKYLQHNYSNRNTIVINKLESIPSGVVIIKIKTPRHTYIQKLIKIR